MELSEAMRRLGEAEAKLAPLEKEVETLRGHKTKLEDDLAKARSARDEATAKAADLETKLPKDGSRVYSKAESERIDALLKLEVSGKTGDAAAIAEALKTGAEAHLKAHRGDTREALRALGYEPTDRLVREFDGVLLTAAKDDADKPVGKVKAGDEEKGLDEWAREKGIEADMKLYRAASERPPVYAGRGSTGGKGSDPVDSYNNQTYGNRK